jgi:hypothetical protein
MRLAYSGGWNKDKRSLFKVTGGVGRAVVLFAPSQCGWFLCLVPVEVTALGFASL